MVVQNRETFKTDFQVSVDAAKGITTGISAADRATPSKSWRSPQPCPRTWSSPVMFFRCAPSRAACSSERGIQRRPWIWCGWPGGRPIAVICEIMSDDGSMARLPELVKFARKHKLKIGTIEALIKYPARAGEAGGAD